MYIYLSLSLSLSHADYPPFLPPLFFVAVRLMPLWLPPPAGVPGIGPSTAPPPLPFWGDGAPTRTQRLLHGLLSVGVQWGFARLRRHGLVHGWGGAEAVSKTEPTGVRGGTCIHCRRVIHVPPRSSCSGLRPWCSD